MSLKGPVDVTDDHGCAAGWWQDSLNRIGLASPLGHGLPFYLTCGTFPMMTMDLCGAAINLKVTFSCVDCVFYWLPVGEWILHDKKRWQCMSKWQCFVPRQGGFAIVVVLIYSTQVVWLWLSCHIIYQNSIRWWFHNCGRRDIVLENNCRHDCR